MTDPRTPLEGDDAGHRAVREALDELRREIRTRFGRDTGAAAEAPAAAHPARSWESTLADLPRRIATLGMRERTGEIDAFGADAAALASARPLLDLLFDRYWSVDVRGGVHLPDSGPYLLVATRSGLLPWDALMIAHAVERICDGAQRPRFTLAAGLAPLPVQQPRPPRLGGARA
jgi:hypothetical protein